MSIITFILVGALAGYVAGKLMRGKGFGLFLNILIGIIGSTIGGWLFKFLEISTGNGFVISLVVATIGAILLIFVADRLKK